MKQLQVGDKVKCIVTTPILTLNKIYRVGKVVNNTFNNTYTIWVIADLDKKSLVGYYHCLSNTGHNRFELVKNTINIPNAIQAREQSNAVLRKDAITAIENGIAEAIFNGKTMAIIKKMPSSIPGDIIDDLKNIGYKVTLFSDSFYIRWA